MKDNPPENCEPKRLHDAFRQVGNAFALHVGENGYIFAVRETSPKFCLRASTIDEAIDKGADALAFYADAMLEARKEQGDG